MKVERERNAEKRARETEIKTDREKAERKFEMEIKRGLAIKD